MIIRFCQKLSHIHIGLYASNGSHYSIGFQGQHGSHRSFEF